MVGWLIIAGFMAASYYYSWWFLIGVVLFSLLKLSRWHYYSGTPWRKIHFPLMRIYAAAAGSEAGQAEIDGRKFEVRTALVSMLEMVEMKISSESRAFVDAAIARCLSFDDELIMRDYLKSVKQIEDDALDSILEKMRAIVKSADNGLLVRMVIASVIEENYSLHDRAEYLFEVFNGRAN